MIDDELQDLAQRCIDKLCEKDAAAYFCLLFLVSHPEIDACIVGMKIEKTMEYIFRTAPFDAHVETIYQLAFAS